MFSSQVIRCARRRLSLLALIVGALSLFTTETFGGTPRFNMPLGEVRGTAPSQVSFDGKHWATLGSGTLPVFDGTLIRTRSGVAALTLQDGSMLEASPTTEFAISAMGSQSHVLVAQGNVVFRLRPSARVRLSIPGGFIQTDGVGPGSSGTPAATVVSTNRQSPRDTLGVVTVQRDGVQRVRLLSGETSLYSKNGSVKERLRQGQSRTILAQSSGTFPLKQYAAADPPNATLPPPTDPPSEASKAEQVWTWQSSNPQQVNGGWQEMKLGTPPQAPPRPDEELRRGFAWAWTDNQWVVARRDCNHALAFRLPEGARRAAATLPPPTDPPRETAKAEYVWAWHPSNPQQVWGGWQEAKLGTPPQSPPRPDQELYDGFVWAWEEPAARWVVVEECDLAAAFLVFPWAGVGIWGAAGGVGAVSIPAGILSTGGSSNPIASNTSF